MSQRNQNPISICAAALAIVCCFVHANSAEHTSRMLIRIDGANFVLYDQEYPYRSLNTKSMIFGNPLDSFPFQHISVYGFNPVAAAADSQPNLAASGQFASEFGDPLFNEYTGNPAPNRDHSSLFGSAVLLPRQTGILYTGYRYTDMYSDRFDEIWDTYQRYYKSPMRYEREGLANDITGGYSIAKGNVKAHGSVTEYAQWGTLPLIFWPVFRQGYKTAHSVSIRRNDRVMSADASFNWHKNYYDHQQGEIYRDLGIRLGYRRPLNKRVNAEFSADINTAISPSTHFEIALDDSFSQLLTWKARGGIFNDLHPFAGLSLSFTPIDILAFTAEAGWDYLQRERSYRFRRVREGYDYFPRNYEIITFHASARYNDTLYFPVSAAVWYDYCDKPIWESFYFERDLGIIQYDTVGNAARSHLGGKANYVISVRKLTLDLWGNLSLVPENSLRRFSAPMFMGVDAGWGNKHANALYIGLRMQYNAGIALQYKNDEEGKIETFTAPAITAVSLQSKIPVRIPFFSDRFASNFWVELGPANITKEFISDPTIENLRAQHHPAGNEIGPRVAVRLDGLIR